MHANNNGFELDIQHIDHNQSSKYQIFNIQNLHNGVFTYWITDIGQNYRGYTLILGVCQICNNIILEVV